MMPCKHYKSTMVCATTIYIITLALLVLMNRSSTAIADNTCFFCTPYTYKVLVLFALVFLYL